MKAKLIPPHARGWVFRPERDAKDFIRVTVGAEATAVARVADLSQATFTHKPSAMLISLICAHFPDAHVTGAYHTPQGIVELIHV